MYTHTCKQTKVYSKVCIWNHMRKRSYMYVCLPGYARTSHQRWHTLFKYNKEDYFSLSYQNITTKELVSTLVLKCNKNNYNWLVKQKTRFVQHELSPLVLKCNKNNYDWLPTCPWYKIVVYKCMYTWTISADIHLYTIQDTLTKIHH
jgi:hypothetical protein